MIRTIFDGKKFAQEKEEKLKTEFEKLAQKGVKPKLVFILVGENKEVEVYVSLKEKMAKRLGVDFETKRFSEKADFETIKQSITALNQDERVSGISFEYPLPEKFSLSLPALITPEKDVDCLTMANLGRLVLGDWLVLPSSVKAVVEILKRVQDDGKGGNPVLKGKGVTIVGFGTLVGRPLAIILKHLEATVTICDEFTTDLAHFTKQAGILISATGQSGLIKKEMVRESAIVIDLGYPSGDCESEVAKVAGFFTPVPGGVGPVTVACLFENLLKLVEQDCHSEFSSESDPETSSG